MSPHSSVRRRLAALFVLAALTGACGSVRSGVQAGDGGKDELFAESASFEIVAARPSRILVGLSTKDGRVLHGGTVRITLRPAEAKAGGEAIETDARYVAVQGPPGSSRASIGAPSLGIGVYEARGVVFPQPGFWLATIHTRVGDKTTSTESAFDVLAAPRVPDVGQAAPRTRNPVIGTPGVTAEQLDSLGEPLADAALHGDVIADAIAAHRPLVVVVSTPAFCISRFCGPITARVNDLAVRSREAGADTAFVHLEVWADFSTSTVNPAAAEWIDPDGKGGNEPWVFVVGRDGRVLARFDNVVSPKELDQAIVAASS